LKSKVLSAGVVVVRWGENCPLYLVLRAYRNWGFPKGIVESGEDSRQAACREVAEETGITDLEFPWGYECYQTAPYGPGKVARYYVALTRKDRVDLRVSPELGRPEHHEFRWVDYQQGLALLSGRMQPVLEWAHQVTRGSGEFI
jgi:bis(5'-nucleosidyl)-tetraphosphatase